MIRKVYLIVDFYLRDVLVLDYLIDVLFDLDMMYRVRELRFKNIIDVEILVV